MTEPTNAVLAEQIKGFRELMESKLEEHTKYHLQHTQRLNELNGQVEKNTEWRIRGKAIWGIGVILIPIIISTIAVLIDAGL